MAKQTFRIFGERIGHDGTFLDCSLEGITDDGRIEIGNPNSDEVWFYDTDSIAELRERGYLYDLADIDTSAPVWKAITELVKARDKSPLDDTSHFDEAIETLFRNAA